MSIEASKPEGGDSEIPAGENQFPSVFSSSRFVEGGAEKNPRRGYELEPGGDVYIKTGDHWERGQYTGVAENGDAIVTAPPGVIEKSVMEKKIENGEMLGTEIDLVKRITISHDALKESMRQHDLEIVSELGRKDELAKVSGEINALMSDAERRDDERRETMRKEMH
ncbi:MAG: hypothetical protein V1656_03540 [Candidatus Jorgensenbacteria bacterium]